MLPGNCVVGQRVAKPIITSGFSSLHVESMHHIPAWILKISALKHLDLKDSKIVIEELNEDELTTLKKINKKFVQEISDYTELSDSVIVAYLKKRRVNVTY